MRKLVAVVFTEDYSTVILFEHDAQTNTVYETIIEYDSRVKVQKLDWEDSIENLQEKIIRKFKEYGWQVCD
jgi:hypothetical protein